MKKKLMFTIASMGFLGWLLYDQNNHLVTTNYTFSSSKIPTTFDGFKIIHLSDLHNKSFKKNQSKLVTKIKKVQPDLVFITGDIIDSRRYNADPSLTLVRELVSFVPVYYVTGNHEERSEDYVYLEKDLIASGVTVLRNETAIFSHVNEHILITGIDDPTFHPDYLYKNDTILINDEIERALGDSKHVDSFHLLLSHRPELLSIYAEHNFDLVFSGHAHGGQIILPIVGGVIAPNQGYFPTYTEGVHTINNTSMVVSRGLGNSLFPFRICNQPEIVLVTLEATHSKSNT